VKSFITISSVPFRLLRLKSSVSLTNGGEIITDRADREFVGKIKFIFDDEDDDDGHS